MKYIIDLDGTLMNGKEPNKDAVRFVAELQKRKLEFVVMTNSIKSPELINKRLEDVGINIAPNRIMNPISSINSYLQKKGYKKAFIVGSTVEVEQINIRQDKKDPSIVILLDFEKDNADFDELQKVFEFVKRGVPIITASKSAYYLKGDKQVLDTGAFVSLFESAAGISIDTFGKPSESYFRSGVKLLDADPGEVTVIGDDCSTDISGANNIGCKSVLIRSGKYQADDELKCKLHKCIDNFMEIFQ